MINNSLNIQSVIIDNLEVLNDLSASLQKEFEYMVGYTSDSDLLQAKKRQVDKINSIIIGQNKILISVINCFELSEKAQLCLMFYGVSYLEFIDFIKIDLITLNEIMLKRKEQKAVQLPLIFESYLDYTVLKEPKKEIKYADRPVIGLQGLADMSEKGIKLTNTFSLKDALKEVDEIINQSKNKTNDKL